jgi:hypothetical protein
MSYPFRTFLLLNALGFSGEVLGQTRTPAVIYDLKDLAVLERERNFEEFLLHVNDIRPSERQKLWRDMYQSMAMEMIDYKLKTKDFSMKAFKQIESVGRSSAMSNDEFFQLKRSLYAKKFFTECYNQASERKSPLNTQGFKTCDTELNSFWYFSKKDADIGLELVRLIEKYPSTLNTWPFYQRAINDSASAIYCERPDIQRAIISKLTKESFDPNFNGNYLTLTNRIVPERCFSKLIPSLGLALKSSTTNGLDKELALNLLEATKNLTKDEEDLYAIFYLMDGPVVGEKMNLAWKKIEKLGELYIKRQQILTQIKSLPQMPDKIFKDPNLPRHKAIINLFAKNFPEYLNYYGESCLNYLENKSETPLNISSSFPCHEFLKTARDLKKNEKMDWVNDTVTTKYSSLRK